MYLQTPYIFGLFENIAQRYAKIHKVKLKCVVYTIKGESYRYAWIM